jgi:hypothetical protein
MKKHSPIRFHRILRTQIEGARTTVYAIAANVLVLLVIWAREI